MIISPNAQQFLPFTNSSLSPFISVDSSPIKFAAWNCSGYRSNEDRLMSWMADNDVDICFLSETWLLGDQKPPDACKFFSARCANRDGFRSRGSNGVSVLVRQHDGLPECIPIKIQFIKLTMLK